MREIYEDVYVVTFVAVLVIAAAIIVLGIVLLVCENEFIQDEEKLSSVERTIEILFDLFFAAFVVFMIIVFVSWR